MVRVKNRKKLHSTVDPLMPTRVGKITSITAGDVSTPNDEGEYTAVPANPSVN